MKTAEQVHKLREIFVTKWDEYEAAMRALLELGEPVSKEAAESRRKTWEAAEAKRLEMQRAQEEYEEAALEYERRLVESTPR